MILKEVEINGFKSFANKIIFKFDSGITAIVGPNGSGKSNVVDAIRWVLGEQKIKQLRGEKMEDVIFAGTETRKSQGFAYVSLTIDNSEGEINYPFQEIKVSRKLYRSGESEYRINDNMCRLKDIHELFYDTGIGKEGYSIIGQGQIDQILSGKPQARRELVDEAIGIVKFKKRKNEAVKKLENDEINLTRLKDILSELEKQLNPLKKQSEKARKYFSIKTQLKDLEKIDFKLYYEETSVQIKKLEKNLEIIDQELTDYNHKAEINRFKTDEIEVNLKKHREKIEKNNNNVQSILMKMNDIANSEKSLNQEIEYNKKLCIQIESNIDKNKTEYEIINERQISLRSKLDNTCNEISKNNLVIAQENIDLVSVKNKIAELKKSLNEIQHIYSDMLEKEMDYIKEATYAKARAEQLENTKKQINEDIATKKIEIKKQEDILFSINERLEYNKNELTNTDKSLRLLENTKIDLEISLTDVSNKINNLSNKKIAIKSNYDVLENMLQRFDGYSFAVKNIFTHIDDKRLIGTLSTIISTKKQYELAIEAALGASLQHIVVEDSSYAKSLIAKLKEKKWGRCTFLPLDTIKSSKKKANNHDGIGIASELVVCDDKFKNIVSNLLDNTLVVKDIDDALKLNKSGYSSKIVTLSGEIIQPQGSITGGSFKNSSSLLSRKREIDELKTQILQVEEDIKENQKNFDCLKIKNDNIQEEIIKNKSKFNEINNNISILTHEQDIIINTIDTLKNDIESMLSELKEKESISLDLPILENNFNKDELKLKIDSINSLIEAEMTKRSNKFENLNRLNMLIARDEKEKELFESEIKRNDIQLKKMEKELVEAKHSIKLYEDENVSNTNKIEDLKIYYEKLTNDHSDLIKTSNMLDEYLTKILNENKEVYTERDTINSQILDLEKEKIRLQNKFDQTDELFVKRADYMFSEYEIVYSDITDLNVEVDRKKLENDIKELKNQIKSFGSINVDAVEEYKQVSERYEFLNNQLSDIEKSKQELTKVIKSLDIGMEKQFRDNFDKLQAEIQRVFRILFGGGNVKMEILEPENILESGININAQPPGKKLQNMLQLSGGEKALTAISLMFAIQNLNPSPFCFLDEIEAALDDYNVTRFAKYINNLTQKTQFIVITHRKGTMTAADRLYGITMQEKGISTMVPVKMV